MKKMVLASAALMSAAATQAQQAAGPVDTLTAQAMQEVVVQGVRAPKNAPFAVSNIKKQDLETFSKTGQELPFLFANTPGVLAWSENGTGMGTSYMRIRGAAGSRINVTLDGVSLNSPEDQTVFWANMNSYAALMGSVQIQRGIGTSTHGDGAFGGSVALATATPSLKPSLELTGSYGSFNTYHAGAKFSTGLLFNHLIFDGAYNETATDGFVHGTASRAGSYYGGLTWLDEKFKVSYKNIGNFEKTGQAWSGVTAGNNDLSLMDGTWGASTGIRTYKDMYEHGLGKYNTLYENLVTDENGQFVKDANGNYQTYRYKMADGSYWEKTTDNFYQNHNILSAVFTPSDHWSHNVAIHYTYGYGYYSELRPDNKLSKFGLTYKDANGNKIKRDDMVRRKGLTQHNYGVLYNINYKDETWNVTGGLYLQQFRGNHFGYLTYFKNQELNNHFRPNNSNYQYYDSDARKFDYSAFFKANYHFNDYWNLFADVQYRYVQYNTSGRNDKFYEETSGYFNQPLNVSERYNFVNPKTGISFAKDGHHAYASIAYANREPERNNFTDNGAYPAPTPERLMDIELGLQLPCQQLVCRREPLLHGLHQPVCADGCTERHWREPDHQHQGQLPHGCRDRGWLVAAELPHPGGKCCTEPQPHQGFRRDGISRLGELVPQDPLRLFYARLLALRNPQRLRHVPLSGRTADLAHQLREPPVSRQHGEQRALPAVLQPDQHPRQLHLPSWKAFRRPARGGGRMRFQQHLQPSLCCLGMGV